MRVFLRSLSLETTSRWKGEAFSKILGGFLFLIQDTMTSQTKGPSIPEFTMVNKMLLERPLKHVHLVCLNIRYTASEHGSSIYFFWMKVTDSISLNTVLQLF